MNKNKKKNIICPRIGVIGTGIMGKSHLRIYSQMNNIHLVSAADINKDLVNSVAKYYRIKSYIDYREMIAREKLDIVSVAVPTHLHATVAQEVINKGINLLIEKPMTATVEEGEKLVKLAKEKDIILGVGHTERFNPAIRCLKKHLQEGTLGRVFQITIRRIGPFPARVADVGVFLDLTTHDIDIMYYLTGAKVKHVYAQSAKNVHKTREDLVVSLLRFNNGIVGVMIENWLSPAKIRDVVVNGERGMFIADFLTQDLYFYENNYTVSPWDSLRVFRGVAEGKMIRYYIPRDEPLRLELESFVKAVIKNKPFSVSGDDGLRAVRLVQELMHSAMDRPYESINS